MYQCLPCDIDGYINNNTSPFNSSYCTLAGQQAGFCIPNQPFEASPYLPLNKTWSNDPKHTFYATQYNDNGGLNNGFVWASGQVGAFGLAYYNLTGSYLFQLAQDYTLFDNFFQGTFGGVQINHLWMVSASVPTWNLPGQPCPTTITQTYLINGANSTTTTTLLYPQNYTDANGVYLPSADNSLFTPDCHVVENVDPFTLGKSPNLRPLTNTHIGDLLDSVGVSWTWYFQSWNQTKQSPVGVKTSAPVSLHEIPFAYFNEFANLNSTYSTLHIRDDDQFFSDLANGLLANVTWVKPNQNDGFGVTDNNPVAGQAKLQSYMDAIFASSYWQQNRMMVLLSFSDSDGLFDHVSPYGGDSYGPGGRVPTIVISPDHANGKINSQPYETTSFLRLLGTRFGLTSQVNAMIGNFSTARLQSANDLTNSFTDPYTFTFGTPTTPANGTTSVGFGYSLQCANGTLDYPCLVQLSGTAIINSTLLTAGSGASAYSYYNMLSFTGTRTFTNRYGAQLITPVTALVPKGVDYTLNILVTTAAAQTNAEPGFQLANIITFPGGLPANQIQLYIDAGILIESINVNGGGENSLDSNPALTAVCTTAPGVVASSYNATTLAPAFYTTMVPCQDRPTFAFQTYNATQTAPGLRQFNLTYSITDNATFATLVSATVSTDGTVNTDQLGNVYYNAIAISGSRVQTSLVNLSAMVTVQISSLMAPNIIYTSNTAYINNNNRLYPQYPYLDRYGLAYTVTSKAATVTSPILADGALYSYTDVVGVYVYRLNTFDEQGLNDNFREPPFNQNDVLTQSPALGNTGASLVQMQPPATYQLVQFCYIMYGLNNTLDYPWSVVLNGTALINNATTTVNVNMYGLNGTLPAYSIVGFVGTRTYTNRYGATLVNAVTADQLGEDANVGFLVPVTPYAPQNSVSFHLNATIQTPGGLPATDFSFFLDPYPIEGTAYGIGVGTGTNALNNDPSRTLFVSNMPGFTPATYSNANTATLAGNISGTTNLSQCFASFQTVAPPAASVLATGIRFFQLSYNITGSAGYNVVATLNLVTDGSVNTDQLGNTYYTIAAITSGSTRVYTAPNGTVLASVNITALLPICSGPSVSNLDAIYCNNNRLYPQYPYVDRLGLAYQESAVTAQDGAAAVTSSATNSVGLVVYRQTILEESHTASGGSPTFTNSPTATITLTQSSSNAANIQAVSWGYIMYCATYALEYPCATVVNGTAILSGSPVTQTGTSATYGPLSGQQAYLIVGFSGTRTFYDQYGESFTSAMSLQPLKEDYADNLLYLTAPYVDGDGPTFRLNGTDGALTEVLGASSTNEINVFQDTPATFVTEGIAVSGSGSSALVYNYTRTIFCSTLPGFVASTANATSQTPAGSTSMSACALPTPFKNTLPKLSATLAGVPYSYAYSISDGSTFTVQTVVTLTTDGNVYQDAIGNRYVLAVAANGTRTYYDWTQAVTTSSAPTATSTITGVVPVSNATTGTLTYTGNKNDNRFYPSAAPHVDVLGISFTLAQPAPITGNSNVTASTVSITSYKDNVLEETQSGGRYPLQQYQATTSSATATASLIAGLPAVTRPPGTPPSAASSAAPAVRASSSAAATAATSTNAAAPSSTTVPAAPAPSSSAAVPSTAAPAPGAPTSAAAPASTATPPAAQPTSAPTAAAGVSVTSPASTAAAAPPVIPGSTNNSGGGSGLSNGQIAGIVVGSVVGGLLLICCCLAALYAMTRRRDDKLPKAGESESSRVQGASQLQPVETSQQNRQIELQPRTTNGDIRISEPVEV